MKKENLYVKQYKFFITQASYVTNTNFLAGFLFVGCRMCQIESGEGFTVGEYSSFSLNEENFEI